MWAKKLPVHPTSPARAVVQAISTGHSVALHVWGKPKCVHLQGCRYEETLTSVATGCGEVVQPTARAWGSTPGDAPPPPPTLQGCKHTPKTGMEYTSVLTVRPNKRDALLSSGPGRPSELHCLRSTGPSGEQPAQAKEEQGVGPADAARSSAKPPAR